MLFYLYASSVPASGANPVKPLAWSVDSLGHSPFGMRHLIKMIILIFFFLFFLNLFLFSFRFKKC